MATVSHPADAFDPLGIPTEPIRRFTIDEYHRLVDTGFFREDESYELIEGWLFPKMTKKPPHEFALSVLDDFIASHISKKLLRRCQLAVTLADSEPEPDLAIVTGPRDKYGDRHPYAEDVLVVIEVADVTLRRDRGPKLRAYARAGIPVYWIVNVKARQVEVHTLPQRATYRDRVVYAEGEIIEIPLGGKRSIELNVSDLFVDR